MTRTMADLPVFAEIDDPAWGIDFAWVTEDLFRRDYQGPMRTSWGDLVVYRNADIAAIQKSPAVSHQSMDTILTSFGHHEPALTSLEEFFRYSTFSMQQPQHMPSKRLIMPPLAPAAVSPFASDFAHLVRERIEAAVDAGEVEFLNQFVRPVVGAFWSRALDIPLEDCHRLMRLAHDFIGSFLLAPTEEELGIADRGVRDYIGLLVPALRRTAERGSSPMVARLLADYGAMDGGVGKPADPIHHFALALVDGFNTLASGLAALVHTLVAADFDVSTPPSDIGRFATQAFMEGSRLHPPVALTMREAIDDLVLDELLIPKGTSIVVLWMLGNRDPEFFPDPDQFRLERENRIRQYTFASGGYVCAGRNVFQALGEVLLAELATAQVLIEPAGPPTWIGGSMTHELSSLPLAFRRTSRVSGSDDATATVRRG